MSFLRSGDSIGPYTVIKCLGRGGMGEVYLGQLPDGETHAVKVMRLASSVDAVERERFAREVAAMEKARSKYIAQLINSDTQSIRPWFSCEYVQGITLTRAVQIRPFNRKQVLTLAFALAVALEALAKAGVVHRDIKPDNIIISPRGVKLIDLGIAQDTNSRQSTLTVAGGAIGTPGFMAPERFYGRSGVKSDVFAIGAVLAFAMTGRSPFGRPVNMSGALSAIIDDGPDLYGIPDDIRKHLIEPCLAADPDVRADLGRIRDFVVAVPHFRSQLNLEWVDPDVREAVMATVQISISEQPSLPRTRVDVQRPAATLAYTSRAPQTPSSTRPASRRIAESTRRGQRIQPGKTGGNSTAKYVVTVFIVMALVLGWSKYHDNPSIDGAVPSVSATASVSSPLRLLVQSDGRTEVDGRGITVFNAKPSGYDITMKVAVSLTKIGDLQSGYDIASKVCLIVDPGAAFSTEYVAGVFVPNPNQTTWSEGTMTYHDVLYRPALLIMSATCSKDSSGGLSFMGRAVA